MEKCNPPSPPHLYDFLLFVAPLWQKTIERKKRLFPAASLQQKLGNRQGWGKWKTRELHLAKG